MVENPDFNKIVAGYPVATAENIRPGDVAIFPTGRHLVSATVRLVDPKWIEGGVAGKPGGVGCRLDSVIIVFTQEGQVLLGKELVGR